MHRAPSAFSSLRSLYSICSTKWATNYPSITCLSTAKMTACSCCSYISDYWLTKTTPASLQSARLRVPSRQAKRETFAPPMTQGRWPQTQQSQMCQTRKRFSETLKVRIDLHFVLYLLLRTSSTGGNERSCAFRESPSAARWFSKLRRTVGRASRFTSPMGSRHKASVSIQQRRTVHSSAGEQPMTC